ncbi:MAG: hypothetical protein JXB88_18225 [Spirochaetales bacterium]|nr:hypothetical protein [Spirochaetales bacterium]
MNVLYNSTGCSETYQNTQGYVIRIVILCLFIIPCTTGYGKDPDKIENLIYSIHAFDGYTYKKTFCREDSGVIYFLENTTNILAVRKAFIYYWPLLGRYRLDTASLNYPIKGRLEIRGSTSKPILMDPVLYTYTDMPEEKADNQSPSTRSNIESGEGYGENLRVLQGADAEKAAAQYEKMMEEYREAEKAWEKKLKEHQEWKDAMIGKIRKAREQGKDVSGLVEEVQSNELYYWMGPERPHYLIMPLSEAFIINLPEGEYRIRLIDDQKSIVEGSEKKLFVFSGIRSEGVLFQYASADRLTKPRESKIPSAVLYVDGSSDLYIHPFLQDEYNEFYHENLMVNEARANKHKTKWEKTKSLDNTWLEKTENPGQKEIILEDLFYINQNTETGAGYDIVYWDNRPGAPHEYLEPSFKAFHIPLTKTPRVIDIRLKTFHGKDLTMSKRQIRVVRKSWFLILVLILALSPPGFMGYMIYRRQKLYR